MNLNENRLLMILADYVMQNVPIIIEYDLCKTWLTEPILYELFHLHLNYLSYE